MADSDNSTSLPFVIHRRSGEANPCDRQAPASGAAAFGGAGEGAGDPVVALARNWQGVHAQMLMLCRRQQQLETMMEGKRDGLPRAGVDLGSDVQRAYAAAKEEEEMAAQAAGELLEELFAAPALSVAGMIAKLEVILKESEVGDAPADFPWPHLRSILADLTRHFPSSAAEPETPAETRTHGA